MIPRNDIRSGEETCSDILGEGKNKERSFGLSSEVRFSEGLSARRRTDPPGKQQRGMTRTFASDLLGPWKFPEIQNFLIQYFKNCTFFKTYQFSKLSKIFKTYKNFKSSKLQ